MYRFILNFVRKIIPGKLYFYIRDIRYRLYSEVDCIYMFCSRQSNYNVMIDVGAHVGRSMIKFALDGWKVYAFEPDNNNRSKLEELVNRYNVDVMIAKVAVSNEVDKNKSFYRSDKSSGISGLSVFDDSHIDAQKVNTTTLEIFCKKNDIDTVNFLKIDAEGWDYFVLKGFPFEKITPQIVLAEFEDHKTNPLGYSWTDMANYLLDKGYFVAVSEWYPVVQYGSNHKFRSIKDYPCELIDKNATGNLIACKNKNDIQEIIQNINKYLKGK